MDKTIAMDLRLDARPTLQVNSTGVEPSHVISTKGGVLLALLATNTSASTAYMQLFDSATVPANNTVPILSVKADAGESLNVFVPVCLSNGITFAASSTANVLTHSAGTKQIETAVVATDAGTITGAGNATVTLTTALLAAPYVLTVPLTLDMTTNEAATAIRNALAADATVLTHFTVTGATTDIILTAKIAAANDATLNLGIIKSVAGGCTGLTDDTSSNNTTAGIAPDIAFHIFALARV